MKSMKNMYDEILKKGLIDYKREEFADVPAEGEIYYEFSDKYQKSKEKMIRKMEKPFWMYTNTVSKRVAVIIVSLIIVAASALTVEAVRTKIVDFAYEVFDGYIVIPFADNHSEIEKFYIAEIDGFEFVDGDFSIISTHLSWANSKGQEFILEQDLGNGSASINGENVTLVEKFVNGTPCLMTKHEEYYSYHWMFDGYNFTLSYPADFGEDFASSVVGKLVEADINDFE